ncbi:Sodium/proton-dependent alanine carrier protein [anaerobic digester metagenome]
MVSLINWFNGVVWSLPMILLLAGLSIYYCVRMGFGTMRNWKLQIKLLFSGNGSADGISPYEAFCTVAAYRVAVGNVGGVCVAIMFGGPGAAFWMMVTSILTTGIAYAENTLGQIYKIRQDGQYRGGPYNYLDQGMKLKAFAILYALLTATFMAVCVTGPSSNNIAMAFENSFGINPYITGGVIAVLLFLVISGGIRRIASFSTKIVPVMTILYLLTTIIIIVAHANQIIPTLHMIITSAFNTHAIFGGMIGSAIVWGVKRAVNSSGAGMGETVPTAATAESMHPGEQGLVNAFSVYIDLAVCLCTATMVLITDCFNVVGGDGSLVHLGTGSAIMEAQAASGTASVVWVQEAASSVMPGIGGIIIALCLTFFAFSTCVAYYYESESALAYLMKNATEKTRKTMIWVLRIVMPIMFCYWAGVQASVAWSVSEICFGLLIWINAIALIFMSERVIKTYKDYISQTKVGIEQPYFNPERLGIKNADLWMDINKEMIEAERTAK